MSAEARALEFLAQGMNQELVASVVGVTASRISQLMADDEFKSKVVELRTKRLQITAGIDQKLDSLEDKVLNKLEKSIDNIYKPGDLLKALQTLNAAKRRGSMGLPLENTAQQTVPLLLPQVIINKFTVNNNNQVVEVIDSDGKLQTLVTAASTNLSAISQRAKFITEENRSEANKKLEQVAGAGFGESAGTKVKTLAITKTERVTVEDLL